MNYLAHLFLAGADPDLLAGQLAGDFVKGRIPLELPPRVREGVAGHRQIDSFTDHHPEVLAFRRMLVDAGRYASIVADLFFDHFLATTWNEYSTEPLADFVTRVHASIGMRIDELPLPELQAVYRRMREEQWLLSYGTIRGVEGALHALSRRLSRRPPLVDSLHYLHDSRESLLVPFRSFFPQAIAFRKRLPWEG